MDLVRSLILLSLLSLASLYCGRAEASCNSQSGACTTIQEAWTRANSDKATLQTNDQNNGLPNYNYRITGSGTQASPFRVQHCVISQYVNCGNESEWSTDYAYYGITGCSAPTPDFDKGTGTCVNKDAQCQALNDGLYGDGVEEVSTRTWTSFCDANQCQLNMIGASCTTIAGVTGRMCTGRLEYSGKCATPTPTGDDSKGDPVADRPQECIPVSGQTMCVKSNGDKCYSASTGKQICWTNGETGTKTDGPVIQRRGPGTNPPPAPTPPEGETLNPPSTPITSTTTGPTTTTTTTTINYTTVNGTNGGPSNTGEPSDGTGSPSDSDDGDGTGVTGGVDCNAQPACTDNKEAVGCAILLQTWKNRCAVEGEGLTAANAALQTAENGLPGEGEGVDPAGVDAGVDTSFMDGPQGWSARGACPVDLNIDTQAFGLFHLPENQLCQVLDALAALVLLAGYVAAGFIVLGGQKGV